MSFRLVPKSVTLNDLERRNNGVMTVTMRYFTEFGRLQAHYFPRRKCSTKNLVLAIYYLLRYSPRLPRTSALCIDSHIRALITHYYFQIQLQVRFYYFCKLPLRWILSYFVLARYRKKVHVRCLIS